MDEFLNAVLFVLIGLEVLIITVTGKYALAGLLAIPIVLAARLTAVSLPITLLRRWKEYGPGTIKLLTWGGLRGGISVALALSIPTDQPQRELIVAMTYVVVVFSILVQGLTVGPLAKRAGG